MLEVDLHPHYVDDGHDTVPCARLGGLIDVVGAAGGRPLVGEDADDEPGSVRRCG